VAHASEHTITESNSTDRVGFRLDTAGTYELGTDLDAGGKLGFTRARMDAAMFQAMGSQLRLDLSLSYEFDNYDFEGSGKFAGLNPWDQVHSVRLGTQLSWKCDDSWSVFAEPMVTLASEDMTNAGDAWTVAGVFGMNWRASDTFSAGLGAGVSSQVEADVTAFPIITFDWRFATNWSLRSGDFDLGSSGGGGIELAWQFLDQWETAFGARYETRRFRLDSSGPAKNGVGEHEVAPVYVRLTYNCLSQLRASAFAGLATLGELEVENKSGERISKKAFDPAPSFGLLLTLTL
jgi:hypothetical protein